MKGENKEQRYLREKYLLTPYVVGHQLQSEGFCRETLTWSVTADNWAMG